MPDRKENHGTPAGSEASMQPISPEEISKRVGAEYWAYLTRLFALWRSAEHEYVKPNGSPRGVRMTPEERLEVMQAKIGIDFANRIPPRCWQNDCYSPRSSRRSWSKYSQLLKERVLWGY